MIPFDFIESHPELSKIEIDGTYTRLDEIA